MREHKDYLSSLNKARRKRNRNIDPRYLLLLVAAVIVVGMIVVGVKSVRKPASGRAAGNAPSEEIHGATPSQAQEAEAGASPEAKDASSNEENASAKGKASAAKDASSKKEAEIEKAVNSYKNLGIVEVSGYLNIRETPRTDGKIIGKLSGDGACEVLDTKGGWSHISSGGVTGYISNQYLFTGDQAKAKAKGLVKLRAVITTDNLNIREAPQQDPSNVVGQALKDERYVVLDQKDGWIQIKEGYISADYASVSYCLNEGRKLDVKAMAINQYDHLVISKVDNYLNVRAEPKKDAKIIGKMTSKAAGEILETLDGWYKIKSGPVIGYISADPALTATGQEAKDIAMETATLKAVITTDVLNVRTEPNTDAKIWTQIVKDERYPVDAQLDGWVQIELDSVDNEDGTTKDKAYISTRDNNVEVSYALNEAIKFSPQEVVANKAASRRSQVVNYALQFVGNPYVWGGTSLTKGADCSGFILRVMGKFGVSLPHYSGSQAKAGKPVTSANMKPGDLIFYADSGGRVNHVSMYIGNGQIVHAASRKTGIKISTWNYRTPVAIRNVLGD